MTACFHLPLHPFSPVVLKDYTIAPGQLTSISWWTLVAYFIGCSNRYESPFIDVFQHIYQLKVITQGALNRMVHFGTIMGHEPIRQNWASNLHLNCHKCIR
ncbi:hypothetical protein J1N35_025485, partial [Gossypium stocksii]